MKDSKNENGSSECGQEIQSGVAFEARSYISLGFLAGWRVSQDSFCMIVCIACKIDSILLDQ